MCGSLEPFRHFLIQDILWWQQSFQSPKTLDSSKPLSHCTTQFQISLLRCYNPVTVPHNPNALPNLPALFRSFWPAPITQALSLAHSSSFYPSCITMSPRASRAFYCWRVFGFSRDLNGLSILLKAFKTFPGPFLMSLPSLDSEYLDTQSWTHLLECAPQPQFHIWHPSYIFPGDPTDSPLYENPRKPLTSPIMFTRAVYDKNLKLESASSYHFLQIKMGMHGS